jgi:hypothetical protein
MCNKKDFINNLENKSGYDTPLDYILSNATMLELPETKKQINYFFDNIFGVGQIGTKETCNTYDKYSYQEKINLKGVCPNEIILFDLLAIFALISS